MPERKIIFTVDTHTMGEPTRVVIGGLGPVPGRSIAEKRGFIARKMDYVRTALMHEPRGHGGMFGAIVVDPADPAADLGAVFMDGGGYLDMCGHGTVGTVAAAMEIGMLTITGPVTPVTLETPAGLVKASVRAENGKPAEVSFRNVPSFLYERDIELDLENHGRVTVDVAYGGNFFALADAESIGLDLNPENLSGLIAAGMDIRARLQQKMEIVHPVTGRGQVELVEFCGPAGNGGAHARNLVVFGRGQFDRSPCGTGTCARMAALHARGKLAVGEPFIHEGILGTRFTGRLADTAMVGKFPAVIPEITANAWVTGIQQFILDAGDPLRYGFHLAVPAA